MGENDLTNFLSWSWIWKAAVTVLVLVVAVVGGFLWGGATVIKTGKAAYDNVTWYNEDGSGIDESAFVKIGGYEQFVRIRSRDLRNPVLFYLHGGPGGAFSGTSHRLFRPLTEYFTVVEWDQRGAGRSKWDEEIFPTMTYPQVVEDAIEVIEYAQRKTGQDKVIVMGSSVGSLLGLGVAKRRPDLVAALVGVGQVLDLHTNLLESRRLMMAEAKRTGRDDVYQELEDIGPDFPDLNDWQSSFDYIVNLQKHLGTFRAGLLYAVKDGNGLPGDLILDNIFSPDTTLRETVSPLLSGSTINYDPSVALAMDILNTDFPADWDWTVLEVPVFTFQGVHDYQAPTTLVQAWFPRLQAPQKTYISFENSAHALIPEEYAKFLFHMINDVRPLALVHTASQPLQ